MGYSEQQKTAYHEASHVVAHLRYGVPFHAVRLVGEDGTITLRDGEVKPDALGTVELINPGELYKWFGRDDWLLYLTVLLAGLCASKIVSPRKTYRRLVGEGIALNDWLLARKPVAARLGFERGSMRVDANFDVVAVDEMIWW
jgi:hypothetical protein